MLLIGKAALARGLPMDQVTKQLDRSAAECGDIFKTTVLQPEYARSHVRRGRRNLSSVWSARSRAGVVFTESLSRSWVARRPTPSSTGQPQQAEQLWRYPRGVTNAADLRKI